MSSVPMRTGAKFGLVAAVAIAAIVALEWTLRSEEELDRSIAAARDAADRAAQQALGSARPLSTAGVTARTVVLCDRAGVVPEAAGEWQVLADGAILVRRPPPLPSQPGAVELPAFAVVLPTAGLRELDPVARAALLDFLSEAWRDRPVATDRLRLQGVGGDEADKSALLGWLR
jgi:hypothetical protein